MKEKDWQEYVNHGGTNRVIADLASQYSGRSPSSIFTLYWFEDKDKGNNNFRERVKRLIGQKLFNEIVKSQNRD